MEQKVNVSKEQQLKDYNTVANFLMSGNKKEVKEFANALNWAKFTEDTYEFMDIKFIRKYKDYIDWEMYCSNAELSEDFIREFADYVDWWSVSAYQHLSEDFIREFADYVDWESICTRQQLSENFIREFKDSVCWDYIDCFQHISDEFRAEFKEYLEEVE